VSTLRYLLSQVPEEGLDIDESLPGDAVRPADAKDIGLQEVQVRGRLTEVGDAWQFRGAVSGTLAGESDWTGEQVAVPFDLRVEWYFVEGDPGDADLLEGGDSEREDGTVASTHAFQGEAIDLSKAAWEEVVLSLPMTMPWQQSAASGLGMDLTKEPYVSGSLRAEEPSPRDKAFGKLAEWFPDARPKQE
jgi:uncharacterized metal-binding protein YceD (DUF177 family)